MRMERRRNWRKMRDEKSGGRRRWRRRRLRRRWRKKKHTEGRPEERRWKKKQKEEEINKGLVKNRLLCFLIFLTLFCEMVGVHLYPITNLHGGVGSGGPLVKGGFQNPISPPAHRPPQPPSKGCGDEALLPINMGTRL
ncbi:hypothetical protein AB205_0021830 [Aquarana catesbeiana]|uniref:Uncharacterized protein n=1 Tax=Aquarana catesbeiana TaxID=8400 RepID=A0A2G9SLP8_AQUCT|nr:hypothetical protein AB205_0021830 [Aquarana catesbeiana]